MKVLIMSSPARPVVRTSGRVSDGYVALSPNG
jgi:hypothetical protein